MLDNQPSKTAWRVALRRAAHQVIDSPLILNDPLAVRIVGEDSVEEFLHRESRLPELAARGSRALRAFVIARSRLAEDALAQAIAAGDKQYVILGAGLDTSAYRSDQANLRTFEVDHPATQTWKRGLLARARIQIPDSTTFVPVDFERESLAEKLAAAGFDPSAPAFFSWLGVVMYLSIESFRQTLAYLGQRPKRTQVIFDYAASLDQLSPRERSVFDLFQTRLTAAGEPFRLFLPTDQMAHELRTAGFHHIEDLDTDEINTRYFPNRADDLRVEGRMGRLILARR